MSLIKYNSATPFKGYGNFFDEFFNNSLSNAFGSDFAVNHPSVNVLETEQAFRLEIAAPGLDKKDFNIQVEKDQLTISAEKEKREESKDEQLNYTRREFNYTSFSRSFRLPETVDPEAVKAGYENGVLIIDLPKKPEKQAKVIQVIDIE